MAIFKKKERKSATSESDSVISSRINEILAKTPLSTSTSTTKSNSKSSIATLTDHHPTPKDNVPVRADKKDLELEELSEKYSETISAHYLQRNGSHLSLGKTLLILVQTDT
jgi:hypothetical protein